MKIIKKYKSATSLLFGFIAVTSLQSAYAGDFEKLDASWYVGGSAGMSRLNPDGKGVWDVTDENDTAKKVYAGVNINRDFGLEAFWNDFGEASMGSKTAGTDAKVSYRGYGANLVYHVPSYLGPVHPILKLGVAKLDTKGDGVTVDQKNNVSIMGGIGAEYELDEGFRIRAEYEYFDKDIDQISIGINWRPVTKREHFDKPREVIMHQEPVQPIVIVNNPAPVIQHFQPAPRPVIRPTPRPVVRPPEPMPKPVVRRPQLPRPKPVVRRAPAPKPVIKRVAPRPKPVVRRAPPPKPIIKTVVKHVPVYINRPAPKPIVKTIIKHAPPVVHRVEVIQQAPPAPVMRKAPPRTIHKTLAGGSHFASSSASLTNAGRGALDRLASDLLRDQVVIHNIGIIGHTDSVGDPLSNQRLSEQRARAVASYLSARGLNRRIMTVLGRGETQPLASNATHAGRAQNRRVNIVVKGSQTLRR